MILKTKRLILRPWEEGDAEDLYKYARNPEIGPPAGWQPHKSVLESLEIIKTVLSGREAYAICLKDDGKAIGAIELMFNRKTEAECELGYWLAKPFWGRGLVPEAGFEMLRRAFEDLGVNKIWCGYYDGNTKSKRVQEKLGFKYAFTKENVDVPMMGEKRTEHISFITKDEWKNGKTSEAEKKPKMNYSDVNAATIDRWVEEGWEWGKPIGHNAFLNAQKGNWDVLLTPTKSVPHEWLGELKGKKVLGLACGGGQQMPIFAALGADCTVLDYSEKQLESERLVAEREGYEIRIIRADMTKPLPFEDGEFDLIFHPVSNCYIREVEPVWRECYRILKRGGTLLSGTDNYINYIVDNDEKEIVNSLPFDPLVNEKQRRQLEADDAGMQFSHTLEEQINGQLEAGFTLLNLYEDTNGEGRLHELNIPTFIAMRSVKKGDYF